MQDRQNNLRIQVKPFVHNPAIGIFRSEKVAVRFRPMSFDGALQTHQSSLAGIGEVRIVQPVLRGQYLPHLVGFSVHHASVEMIATDLFPDIKSVITVFDNRSEILSDEGVSIAGPIEPLDDIVPPALL